MALEIINRDFVCLSTSFLAGHYSSGDLTFALQPHAPDKGLGHSSLLLGQTGCTGTGLAPASRGKTGQELLRRGLPQPRHPAHSLPLNSQFFTCKPSSSSSWPAKLHTPQLSPSLRLAATVLVIPLPYRSPFMSLGDRLTKSLAEWTLRPARCWIALTDRLH